MKDPTKYNKNINFPLNGFGNDNQIDWKMLLGWYQDFVLKMKILINNYKYFALFYIFLIII